MDTTLLLHERLLLLVLDDEKGTNRTAYADPGLAGAVLLDLVRLGTVDLDDDQVIVSAGAAAPAGVLADSTAAIRDEAKRRDARWWVDHLPGRLKPFLPRLADRLVQTGVLTEEQHKVLGLFPTTRLPERDHRPEAEVRDRLRSVLLGDRAADEEDAILAGLAGALDLLGVVVDKSQRKDAARRAKELSEGNEFNQAVGEAIRAAQAAVTAAVIAASTAATTSAATSGPT